MTEDEVVGWHHQLYGHEFEQSWGNSGGQRSLAHYSLWGHKESVGYGLGAETITNGSLAPGPGQK